MLNGPLFPEAALELAARPLRDGGVDDPSRMRYAFRRCVGRGPEGSETDELLSLLKKEERRFTEAGRDPAPISRTADPRKAAWTAGWRGLLHPDGNNTQE